MSVVAQLDNLRASVPGCSVVVFGDLFSQITLCVSAAHKNPQEQLDALCVTAGNLLDGPTARAVAPALGVPVGNALNQAIILTPVDIQLFLRSPTDVADVLCCVCSLDSDVDQALTRSLAALEQIAQGQ